MSNSGIGFIGLGQMGLGMANNLAKIAAPFYAYDAVSSAADQLDGDDIIIASTVGNLAANCHLIFLCLPSAKEVNEVILALVVLLNRHKALLPLSTPQQLTVLRPLPSMINWQAAALPMLIARFPAFPFVPQMAH